MDAFQLDISKPIVTNTDWDAECELLKDYLRYRIDNYTSELMFDQTTLSLNNVVLSSVNLDPNKLMRFYSEMGFLIVNSDNPPTVKPLHPVSFDQWKQLINHKSFL